MIAKKTLLKLFLIAVFLVIRIESSCSSCGLSSSTPRLYCNYNLNPSTTICNCKNQYPITCRDCGISFSSTYYSFDEYGNCLNECLGDKILFTGECTSRDLDLSIFYKLGDYYYYPNPSNININCPSHICKCNNYYYIEDIFGKKVYRCDSIGNIPTVYKYRNYKTNEFFKEGCPPGFTITFQETISGRSVTRCSDRCLDNEFYFSTINANSLKEEYCSTTCNLGIYVVDGVKKMH